jgi:hypothetical protein
MSSRVDLAKLGRAATSSSAPASARSSSSRDTSTATTTSVARSNLERFVLADVDEGRYDEELIVLLHERNLRAQMLNGPPDSAIARHNTIQSFHG